MSGEFTLGKEERLKSNLSIQELLKHGKAVSRFPLKIYWDFEFIPYDQLEKGMREILGQLVNKLS
jgi:hypothetical protein